MAEALRAIDANVILRYFLRDVPAQAVSARRLIESERPVAVTAVVLAEVAWTLARPLDHYERREIAEALIELLTRENVVAIGFEKGEAALALAACARDSGAANFGDALIAACARSYGVSEIYTFDQQFARAGLVPIDVASH